MFHQAEVNHSRTFVHECSLLLDYKNMYGSILNSVFDDYAYFLEVESTNVFSKKTISLYKVFFLNLKNYLESTHFGRDQTFVFLDPNWLDVRKEYLLPFITSAEKDFANQKVDFVSIVDKMDLNRKPNVSEILERVNFLYLKIKE